MLSRRKFLQTSSIVSLAPVVPQVFANTARAAVQKSDEKILVVIQMDGGNDGLNTVVPFNDDNYGRARKKLKIAKKDTLKLTDDLGLHPSMKAAKKLFDDGLFSIVQGVGYPNPDRSHFRSMKIWQTALFDDDRHDHEGWLGRTLGRKDFAGPKDCVYVGPQETPVSLWGRRSNAVSISRAEDLKLMTDQSITPALDSKSDLDQFVSKQVLSAYASSKEMSNIESKLNSENSYPRTRLGSQLELIAKLLKNSTKTRIFYTTQNGYDTHSVQAYDHSRLLREYSDALKSFLDDMKKCGLEKQVVVMTFSEFGRRVNENDSAGTDHGTAGPVFLAGEPVKAGLFGDAPDLADLDNGDIKMQYDFRQIYATILDRWLEVDAKHILESEFEQIPLFG